MKLSVAIQPYVAQKRANGCFFRDAESTLATFCKSVGDADLSQITTQDVERFLNRSTGATSTWRAKYYFLMHFFEYWFFREAMPNILMPPLKPRMTKIFVPHVYSKDEIRSLLIATTRCQQGRVINRRTLRTLLLFLYGTGARLGEVIDLRCEDLNLKTGRVTFRGERFMRGRTIPLNSDLREIVQNYLRWRTCAGIGGKHLFVNQSGDYLSSGTVRQSFARLCNSTGVRRRDGTGRTPRVTDLRNTFAVHRIKTWIRNGIELSSMLPALAVYMGHLCLESTERYVLMTPERFSKQLNKLSPTIGKNRWRNNEEVMALLSNYVGVSTCNSSKVTPCNPLAKEAM